MVNNNALHPKAIFFPLLGGKTETMEPLVKGCKIVTKAFRLRPKFTARAASTCRAKDVSRSSSVSFMLNDIQSSLTHISMSEVLESFEADDEFAEFVLDVPRASDANQVWCKREQHHAASFEPTTARRSLFTSSVQCTKQSMSLPSLHEETIAKTTFQASGGVGFSKHLDFGSCDPPAFLTPPRPHNHLPMRLNQRSNPFRPDLAAISCDTTAVSYDSSFDDEDAQSQSSCEPTTPFFGLYDDSYYQTPRGLSSCAQRSRPFPASIYLPDI